MRYSTCIQKLRDDLIEYIDSPTDKKLRKIKNRIPEYIFERVMEASSYSGKNQTLILECGLLAVEMLDRIDDNSSLNLRRAETISNIVTRLIDRVRNVRDEDYKMAQHFAAQRGIDFGR